MTNNDTQLPEINSYWNEFYSHQPRSAPMTGSTFSEFVADTLSQVHSIVEVGCGNGRDTRFFASRGLRVLALDASEEAILVCANNQEQAQSAEFVHASIEDAGEKVRVFSASAQLPLCFYARFVLHAITEDQERSFYRLITETVPPGSFVALEYRTNDDELAPKVYGSTHYRRFIDHQAVCQTMMSLGFDCLHEIKGSGLAPHRGEDPVVGRYIGKRREA